MEQLLQSFASATGIAGFMNSAWGWPVVESLHFTGMCFLIGTVGVFDLRLLGIARGISPLLLHRLIPFGVAGFALNVTTGVMFVVSAPDQYLYNPAFQTKLTFMVIASLNMLLFYRTAMGLVVNTPAGQQTAGLARLLGGVSLACWAGVIVCGRLITYFRPPYHWCFWC